MYIRGPYQKAIDRIKLSIANVNIITNFDGDRTRVGSMKTQRIKNKIATANDTAAWP